MKIPFNKPFLSGKEIDNIIKAIKSGKISGNGYFTNKCQLFFEKRYGFKKTLLTTSCTDALEMSAILLNIQPGDEVIIPSFTFVSTANAFVLRGARIIFADSEEKTPNLDVTKLESLINKKTKAIVVVHYAGVSCNMDQIMDLSKKYNLFVIEDAAHAIDSYYKGNPLGSIGHLSAFSFHETKNIISGEGGMLVVNDEHFRKRSEIIWEKGTNRTAFFRGEVEKYEWVDIGSSFLPSEIGAAFLYAQLEQIEKIQNKRLSIWNQYYERFIQFEVNGYLKLPKIPDYTTNNGHIFYIICRSLTERTSLINYLKQNNISAVFHYLSLHNSPFYKDKHDGRNLPFSDYYSDCLLRLPLFFEMTTEQIEFISNRINKFYKIYS